MHYRNLGPLYLVIALLTVLAFGLLAAFPVHASPGDDGCIGNCGGGGNPNADSRARALSYSAALTRVDNQVNVTVPQATQQPTAQPLTINNTLPSQQAAPVTVNNNLPAQPEPRGKIDVRTVPNVFAGNVYPTAPCMGSSSVGASALGWGAAIGTSWADHECGKRETARSFQNLGLTANAIAVLCSSEYAAVAPVCKAK